ncbi:hypothetical protein L7F22_027617 [Adiantum nelumboides]|nr:hypothetical protein [Adiantum nelumboides]
MVSRALFTKLRAVRGRQQQSIFSSAHPEKCPPRELKRKGLLTLLREPNDELVRELAESPQLAVESLPLLSSCLPPSHLCTEDFTWIKGNISSIKEALLYPPSTRCIACSVDKENPLFHLDSLLYLAFQHMATHRSLEAKYVKVGHSRLSFLGQFVSELALVEYFLLRYPLDVTACIRERIYGLTSRRILPHWIESAGLRGIVFAPKHMKEVDNRTKFKICRNVFWAILGVSYLYMGMHEVYRVLFEVFGLDPDAEHCQPSPRLRYKDVDKLYPEFEQEPLHWKDVAGCRGSGSSLFTKQMLFRACVPPGMSRFRGNMWAVNSLPTVLEVFKYPLQFEDEDAALAISRNEELELGLQGQQTHEVGEWSRPPQTEDEIFRTQLVVAVSMFTQVMQNPRFMALLQPPPPSQSIGNKKLKSEPAKAQPQVIHTA